MIDTLLSYLAPHYCYGCNKSGALLCDNCKYDITSEPFEMCVACGQALAGPKGVCSGCKVAYQRAWCVGERGDILRDSIDHYKFMNSYAAHKDLALLLDGCLPFLSESTIIVPIPTISSHIRQRGYDHMYLIAKHLAKRRGLRLTTGLVRRTATRQRDASASVRERQAKEAFAWSGKIDPKATYLIIDDVVTTGATLKYAAKTLRQAGASRVWVAAICRQPLD